MYIYTMEDFSAMTNELLEISGDRTFKDSVLSPCSGFGFDPWHGNFCMPWLWPKKKKKEKKRGSELSSHENIQIHLKCVLLSESQAEKATYHMTLVI